MQSIAPSLEGIKIEGRWAVIYSRYDIGCALEKHAAPDCLGHRPRECAESSGGGVVYMLRRVMTGP